MGAWGDDPHCNFPRTVVLTDKPFASYRLIHGTHTWKGCFKHESQMSIVLLGARWKADSDALYNFYMQASNLSSPNIYIYH